jgi:hypothetical protein
MLREEQRQRVFKEYRAEGDIWRKEQNKEDKCVTGRFIT